MFGIGFPEMIVILVVALLVVGPDKLPELARSMAKGVNELRGAMNQIKESLNEETKDLRSVKDDLRQTAVQMKDKLLEEDLGGPRQPANEDAVIEMEADLAEDDSPRSEDDSPRSWEEDAATLRRKQEKKAMAESDTTENRTVEEDDAEKRVIGRNPELVVSENMRK
jgi:sec-independent protein translocase protein TatB